MDYNEDYLLNMELGGNESDFFYQEETNDE